MAIPSTALPAQDDHRHFFAADIFKKIVANQSANVVFSPAAIQTCLVLTTLGAAGRTGAEMRDILKIGNVENDAIIQNYAQLLTKMFSKKLDDKAKLIMANRIYVNKHFEISQVFHDMASKNFQTQIENMNFVDCKKAAEAINCRIAQETFYEIKNFLRPEDIAADTASILVNVIFFKAKWAIPFTADCTRREEFIVKRHKTIMVDMMCTSGLYCYAESEELDATIIQLDYKNSDLKMLIILPNKVRGLETLESKLHGKTIHELREKMEKREISLKLPKFQIDFDVDLRTILEDMGMHAMFSDDANFSGIVPCQPLRVDRVRHKTFLDVSEGGSLTRAFSTASQMPVDPYRKCFIANHPFVFMICSRSGVFFAGHVTFRRRLTRC